LVVPHNGLVVGQHFLGATFAQMQEPGRVEPVQLLGGPQIVSELGSLGLVVVLAPRALMDDRIGLGSGNPVALAVW